LHAAETRVSPPGVPGNPAENERAIVATVPGTEPIEAHAPARPQRRLSFRALLNDDDRAALDRLGRRAQFPPGTVLLHEGINGEAVFVLLEGVVKATSVTAAGREVVLAFRGPGELIGDLAIIDGRPHSSTVVAVERVEALVIGAGEFRAFVAQSASGAVALIRMVVDRFRDTDRKLVEFSASDALGRVASRLWELSDAYGEPSDRGVAISLHLSQEELAGWAACSQKAVVNALQTLRHLGLVETGRRRITVLDPEALRLRAHGA
jgi:CRP/FNR family transcriptional regulator, cyclic AMP receptor protein